MWINAQRKDTRFSRLKGPSFGTRTPTRRAHGTTTVPSVQVFRAAYGKLWKLGRLRTVRSLGCLPGRRCGRRGVGLVRSDRSCSENVIGPMVHSNRGVVRAGILASQDERFRSLAVVLGHGRGTKRSDHRRKSKGLGELCSICHLSSSFVRPTVCGLLIKTDLNCGQYDLSQQPVRAALLFDWRCNDSLWSRDFCTFCFQTIWGTRCGTIHSYGCAGHV